MKIIFYKKTFYRKVDVSTITDEEVETIKNKEFLDLDKLPEGVIDSLVDIEQDDDNDGIDLGGGVRRGRPVGSKNRTLSEKANVSGKQPVRPYPTGEKPEKKRMSISTKRIYNCMVNNPEAKPDELARILGMTVAAVNYHRMQIYHGGNWLSKFPYYRTVK